MQQEPTRRFPKEDGQGKELLTRWVASREEAEDLVALDAAGQSTRLLLLLNTESASPAERAAVLEAAKVGRYKFIPSKKAGKLGVRVVLYGQQ